MKFRLFLSALGCLFFSLVSPAAQASTVSVAVASNFTQPMRAIARAFHQATGNQTRLAFGSSGNFYAQIKNGAPFQVFLSADAAKPRKLEQAGLTVKGSRFTYAIGGLVLWSSRPDFVKDGASTLRHAHFNKLGIANPKLAPYGSAAVQVLQHLHLYHRLTQKFVMGENIAQTYQFVMSGNADLGFVAQSQVTRHGKITQGSGWIVPANLHKPIRQDAVLLLPGKHDPAALALLRFLKGARAHTIMQSYGYH
ncbi:MAG: molybdate ABC transporter substrate-binding protein [Gammaproteobacteria bacterium]